MFLLLPAELRAAGGWVRDKLLGFPSTDIDIAIDTTSGARFAAILNQCAAASFATAANAFAAAPVFVS